MKRIQFLFALVVAVILCGCDKQMQVNTQKIDVLTQKMFTVQQNQSRQMADIQAQLTALSARLDKTGADYFIKSQDKALFYHTNTLYFLLTIDKKIQSELQLAEAARDSANSRAFFYHTNMIDTVYFCTSQMADGMAAQEKRMEDSVKDASGQLGKTLGEELARQKQISTADKAEMIKRLDSLETKLTQIQHDLDQLKARLPNAGSSQP
jgi:hypothetical protein